MDTQTDLSQVSELAWLSTPTTARRQPHWAKLYGACDWPRISIIIPTLNEAENLRYVLPLLPSDVDEVLLVDGASTDGTVEVARTLYPQIRVLQQAGRGKGAALRTGLQYASGDIIVLMDADGSTDPRELPTFIGALMAGADYVKGSRFLQGAGSADLTFSRRLGNWGLTSLVRLLCGGSFTDLCYGYNAFWADVVPRLALDADGFEIETQLNLRALLSGINVAEVPSFEAARLSGESHLHALPDGWRVLNTILRERFGRSAGLRNSHAGSEPPQGRRNAVWAMLSGDCLDNTATGVIRP